MTENIRLMRDAKAALRGQRGKTALYYLALTFILSAGYFITMNHDGMASTKLLTEGHVWEWKFQAPLWWRIDIICMLVLGGPMTVGYIGYLRRMREGGLPGIENHILAGFRDFTRSFLAYLFVAILVTLWTLLLIIPGIVMSLAYSMTMFIIAEDPNVSAIDAVRRSRDMMRGHKWKLFRLYLRFLGWIVLCILTLGILFLWVGPYIDMATLNFYHDVKADREAHQSSAAQ